MRVSTYRRISVPVRAALLMPLGALAVHQLRYYLIFGAGAPARLAREGHGYLATAEPFVLLAAAIALGAFVGRLVRAHSEQKPDGQMPANPFLRTTIVCAVVLFALYCGQELVEGMLASGHSSGIAGILGHGGLVAVPISAIVAAMLALALRSAASLIGLVARRRPGPRRATPERAPRPVPGPRHARDWRLEPQSGVVADRAPPLALLPLI